MNIFLKRVAALFLEKQSNGISDFIFVFPNRRAGLFFRHYLSELATTTFFAPTIITINDCFQAGSDLQRVDRTESLFRLYEHYKKISGSDESFDTFVFWGDMLLADFNEVDRYLVDVHQLYINIKELNEIDQLFDTLTPEQIEAIREFWKTFNPVNNQDFKATYMSTWKIMSELYEAFTSDLIESGLATDGMISRILVEKLKNGQVIEEWRDKKFVFVGFNALNPCEKSLMSELNKRQQADFYWDYDSAFLRDPDNPASHYCLDNLRNFPSRLPLKPVPEDLQKKHFQLVSVPSTVGMTKYVYELLNSSKLTDNWMKTAVILPDEKLLLPMLSAFPECIEKINITMGYPLQHTPVAGFVSLLFDMYRRIRITSNKRYLYHKSVSDVLNHQLVSQLYVNDIAAIQKDMTINNRIYVDDEIFAANQFLFRLFSFPDSVYEVLPYLQSVIDGLIVEWKSISTPETPYSIERDYMLQYKMTVNRLQTVIGKDESRFQLSIDTLGRLLQQLINGESIPFLGEPLDGLQVMGVLESRGLDFERLIITSFSEGIIPAKHSQNSFIPNVLRRGFGLPTFELADAIASYNFYRLIQHAKELYFIFDSRTDGLQSGEVSRFLNQLKYLYGCKIEEQQINFNLVFAENKVIKVQKTLPIQQKLARYYATDEKKKYLSASSIKTYIDCPLQFYLSKVEMLNEADEVQESIEDNVFGSIFHKAMEHIYYPYIGREITMPICDDLLRDEYGIDLSIRKAFASEFFKTGDALQPIEGRNLMIATVLRKYILKVLAYDKQSAPFKILNTEFPCEMTYPAKAGNVNIKGIIDRVDEKDGYIRVLDYKTGKDSLEFTEMCDLFDKTKENRPRYVLQTFLYGMLYKQYSNNKAITPGIIYLRNLFKDDFKVAVFDKKNKTEVLNYENYEQEFIENLSSCIDEIFDPNIAFEQTNNKKTCSFCNFTDICNR